jgi:hypothetical protein
MKLRAMLSRHRTYQKKHIEISISVELSNSIVSVSINLMKL